jgi:hypothetical protein
MAIQIADGWLTGSLPDDTGREWPVVQRRQESVRGPLRPATPNLILHTTETTRYIDELKFPSQWQTGEGQIGQHIKLGLAGDAVNNWDAFAQQIEMVARVADIGATKRYLPEEATLGPTVALVAWLHKTERIKTGLKRPASWPVVLDKLPAATEDYYRRKAGVWPDEPGVYGHVEIPDNSHYDPASFDYPTFFERVQRAVEGDEMGYAEFEKGLRARRHGDPLGQDPNPDFALGWDLADDIKQAAKTPEPGIPAAHEHSLVGKAQ